MDLDIVNIHSTNDFYLYVIKLKEEKDDDVEDKKINYVFKNKNKNVCLNDLIKLMLLHLIKKTRTT